MRARFWRAFGLYAGGVIGVGLFGLPKALLASGVLPFVALLGVVAVLAWWIQRSYLSVVLASRVPHRLPGYARASLGPTSASIAAIANLLGLAGALVAYILAGGTFLQLLLEPFIAIPPAAAMVLYVLPGALLLLGGIRALPTIELVILVLFLLVLALLTLLGGSWWTRLHVPAAGTGLDTLLPYGVLLFALWGVSLVPETAELAGRDEKRAVRVLAAGVVTAAATYLLFALLIAGITGPGTTEDALQGLQAILGDGVVQLALIFGVLTTFSSYIALGLTLAKTLSLDFKVPRLAAWAVTIAVPFLLVLGGVRSLLAVLGVTGAVFLGVEGLVVLALRAKLADGARPRLRAALVVTALLLVVGLVSEVVRSLLFSS